MSTSASASVVSSLTKDLIGAVDTCEITSSKDVVEAALNSSHGPKVFATHSQTFHCDECFAIMLLLANHLGTHDSSSPMPLIVRTRDPSILSKADVVVDVGGEYDPSKMRFDHHHKDFITTFDESHQTTKLSSAGLVYKHLGKSILERFFAKLLSSCDEANCEIGLIHRRVYDTLIEYVDARDNGVSLSSDGQLKYELQTDLGTRVAKLNTRWYEADWDDEASNRRFRNALKLVVSEFVPFVEEAMYDWWPARKIVKEAMEKRFDVASHGQILSFSKNCPFDEHLYELEDEMLKGAKPILFVVYPAGKAAFRIRAVATSRGTFGCRMPLSSKLRGESLENLKQLTGVADVQFVHNAGFIGGAGSLTGAIQLAELTIKENEAQK